MQQVCEQATVHVYYFCKGQLEYIHHEVFFVLENVSVYVPKPYHKTLLSTVLRIREFISSYIPFLKSIVCTNKQLLVNIIEKFLNEVEFYQFPFVS